MRTRQLLLLILSSLLASHCISLRAARGEEDSLEESICRDPFLIASGACDDCLPHDAPGLFELGETSRWVLRFDFLSLKRELGRAPILTAGVGGPPVVSASQFDTGYDPGFELEARRDLGNLWLDVRYFQVDSINATMTRNGGVGDSLFGLVAARPSLESFSYGSDLYNTEVNLLAPATSWLRGIVGLRYLLYQESSLVHFHFPDHQSLGGALTQNDLFGLQIGGEADLLRHNPRYRLGAVAKGGLYGAYSQSRALMYRPAGSAVLGDDVTRAAFVGELGLNASVVLTHWLSIEGGYRALFIDGIALAGEQYSTTSMVAPATRINQGDVILHGFNVGLVANW